MNGMTSQSRQFFLSILDSVLDNKPYFEKKDVILCRSGIQEYTFAEVRQFGLENPKVVKDSYKVYRPASALIASKDKMTNLPITREHPPEFINGGNFQRFAHGYTGSEAEVVRLGDGEIGIQSKLMFSTNDVYNYYLNGNSEVSLGYVSKNEWVDDPDKVGYDILMVGIEDVNHLAVTAAGRGGSRVAIIDSSIGGLIMFKTGLFHFLKKKGKTTDAPTPFSKTVFDSLEAAKTMEGDKLEAEVKRVMDSLTTLKDGTNKALLMDSVADCYKAIDTAIVNRDEVGKFLDSVYEKAEKETLDSVQMQDAEPDKKDDKDDKDDKKKAEVKDADPEADKDKKNEDEDGKGTGTKNVMDSVLSVVQDALTKNNEALAVLIDQKIDSGIKSALGLKEDTKAAGGSTQDSNVNNLPEIDISAFVL